MACSPQPAACTLGAMNDHRAVAHAAVEEAGRRLRAAWSESKSIEHKGAIDLVTETDRERERMLVERPGTRSRRFESSPKRRLECGRERPPIPRA